MNIKLNDNIAVILTRSNSIARVKDFARASQRIAQQDNFDAFDAEYYARISSMPYGELLADALKNGALT